MSGGVVSGGVVIGDVVAGGIGPVGPVPEATISTKPALALQLFDSFASAIRPAMSAQARRR